MTEEERIKVFNDIKHRWDLYSSLLMTIPDEDVLIKLYKIFDGMAIADGIGIRYERQWPGGHEISEFTFSKEIENGN